VHSRQKRECSYNYVQHPAPRPLFKGNISVADCMSLSTVQSMSSSDGSVIVGQDTIEVCDIPVTWVCSSAARWACELTSQRPRVSFYYVSSTCDAQPYPSFHARRLLGRQVAAQLVSAFVISRLDYGNATLSGLPQFTLGSRTTTASFECSRTSYVLSAICVHVNMWPVHWSIYTGFLLLHVSNSRYAC